MARNKIEDLRNHLFEVIEMLKDGDIDIEKAQTISDVAQVIVNSAKVEVDFMKVVHGNGSGFIPLDNRGEYQLVEKNNISLSHENTSTNLQG
jgi:hypothetical protein